MSNKHYLFVLFQKLCCEWNRGQTIQQDFIEYESFQMPKILDI